VLGVSVEHVVQKTGASELAKCKLYLVGIQEVRWTKGGSKPPYNYKFFCAFQNTNHHLGTDLFVHEGIRSS
jgi:hypothetical protein